MLTVGLKLLCLVTVLSAALPARVEAEMRPDRERLRKLWKALRPGDRVALMACRTPDHKHTVLRIVDPQTGQVEQREFHEFVMYGLFASRWKDRAELPKEIACFPPSGTGGSDALAYLPPALYQAERKRTLENVEAGNIESLVTWGLVQAEVLGFLCNNMPYDVCPAPDEELERYYGVSMVSPLLRIIDIEAHHRPIPTPENNPEPDVRDDHAQAPKKASSFWTVFVLGTPDRKTALETVLVLRGKNFDAFAMTAGGSDNPLYRVLVGRFDTQEEATEQERRLRSTGRYRNAYVVSQ